MPGRFVRLGGVTAMAVTTLSVFALVACSSDDSNPLFGNDWTLTSAVDDGKSVDTSLGFETRWRFSRHGGCGDTSLHCPDGQEVVGTIVCNDFTLSLQADADRIVWGDEGETTTAGCGGDLDLALFHLFESGPSPYTVANDRLSLTTPDGSIELTFQKSDGT